MTPALLHIGECASPLLIVDGAGPEPQNVIALAEVLAPFPKAQNNYPGIRRILSESDVDAWAFVISMLEAAKPYIAGAFDLDGFDLVEASFSMVTTPPHQLSPVQRVPHFDSTDSDLIALLYYVSDCLGTAFYRHRATRVEIVTAETVNAYVAAAKIAAVRAWPEYFRDGDAEYERIGSVDGPAGRLVAYPGRLLHSGIIAPDFIVDDNPATGRLTANIFLRGWEKKQQNREDTPNGIGTTGFKQQ